MEAPSPEEFWCGGLCKAPSAPSFFPKVKAWSSGSWHCPGAVLAGPSARCTPRPISRSRRPASSRLGYFGEPCSARSPCPQKTLHKDTQRSSLWLLPPSGKGILCSGWPGCTTLGPSRQHPCLPAPLATLSKAQASPSAPCLPVMFPQELLGTEGPSRSVGERQACRGISDSACCRLLPQPWGRLGMGDDLFRALGTGIWRGGPP